MDTVHTADCQSYQMVNATFSLSSRCRHSVRYKIERYFEAQEKQKCVQREIRWEIIKRTMDVDAVAISVDRLLLAYILPILHQLKYDIHWIKII
jgi:hypothetical protein